nr:M20/M25/M40 family metallo-hydrolase [Pseudoruegeria sp. HB172150]
MAEYAALPFDAEVILAGVRPWVTCESPSWDVAAVEHMLAIAAADMAAMGARIRSLPTEYGRAGCVLADFGPETHAPGILILSHLDTVHPLGSLAGAVPWRRDGDKAHGPGLFDMKSGAYLALEALRQLSTAGISPKLPVRVMMTGDEESGSVPARPRIEAQARAEKYVLVPEGAQPNGHLVTGRLPSARFRIFLHGRPSHALLQKEEGTSSILAMATLLQRIEAMTDGETALTASIIQAGQAVSSVPLTCMAEVVCVAPDDDKLDAIEKRIRAMATELPGIRPEIDRKTHRPTWWPGLKDRQLADLATKLGRGIGLDLEFDMLAGGSDGNFTGAIGVPTLDGLGPVGADAHQLSEHIFVSSIVPRGRLLAGLIAELE